MASVGNGDKGEGGAVKKTSLALPPKIEDPPDDQDQLSQSDNRSRRESQKSGHGSKSGEVETVPPTEVKAPSTGNRDGETLPASHTKSETAERGSMSSKNSRVGRVGKDGEEVDPNVLRDRKAEFTVDATPETDVKEEELSKDTRFKTPDGSRLTSSLDWLASGNGPVGHGKGTGVIVPAHPDWSDITPADASKFQRPKLIVDPTKERGPVLAPDPPRAWKTSLEPTLVAPEELLPFPVEHLRFYWEDWLQTLAGAAPRRSMKKEDLVMRVTSIFGYPPALLYQRFLNIRKIPWEEIEIVLYILGCVRMPVHCGDLPSIIQVYMANSDELRRVYTYKRNSEELRWLCQSSHGHVQPATFVEALIEAGEVQQIGKAKHRFPHDNEHPFFPLRSFEDNEI